MNYNIEEAARLLSVSVRTMQRWDNEGRLKALRTPGNRRTYPQAVIDVYLHGERKLRNVAYCRVSSKAQEVDLKRQREAVGEFVTKAGIANVEFIEEIGGGLNLKRKKFQQLLDDVSSGKIGKIVVAHKDRLSRFGYDLIAHICERNNCELIVINNEKLSPHEEMVTDLMTIMHCFSSRLYGLRKYKKAELRKMIQ